VGVLADLPQLPANRGAHVRLGQLLNRPLTNAS
jgi:hypothetical protein